MENLEKELEELKEDLGEVIRLLHEMEIRKNRLLCDEEGRRIIKNMESTTDSYYALRLDFIDEFEYLYEMLP